VDQWQEAMVTIAILRAAKGPGSLKRFKGVSHLKVSLLCPILGSWSSCGLRTPGRQADLDFGCGKHEYEDEFGSKGIWRSSM